MSLALWQNSAVYTHDTSICRIQLELETPLGKALIEDNGCSIVEINNVV